MPAPLAGAPRLLVLDAYAPEGRLALREAGGTPAGTLYAALLQRIAPGARVHVAFAADPDPGLEPGVALGDYDGAVWTGSSLTIHAEDDARVTRQVELARALLEAGVPNFGSCWAIQLAALAGGGSCGPSPRGREFGVARGITLNATGRAHPLFRGKPERFDALASHADEVRTLPPGARVLAGNDFSGVQAAVVPVGRARFQAVQYHPEYDLHEIACLARLRAEELVTQGQWPSVAAALAWADDLETLQRDPGRDDLARAHALLDPGLGDALRHVEVVNWLECEVLAAR